MTKLSMNQRTLHLCRSVLFGRAAVAFELLSLVLLSAGCSSGEPRISPPESVAQAHEALQGADGAATITAANSVVNQYTALTADVAAGVAVVSVQSAAALNPGADPLAAGDLLLVVQMQGATINTAAPAAATWGQVTSLGNAGNYELVEVASIAGNTVTLTCGLKNAYSVAGNVQVVRVPQYTTLTVNAGASITAPAWNGTIGGVVAVRVQNAITLNGDIDVTGKGFRGGVADNASAAATVDTTTYASAAAADGGNKGEGIAGQRTEFGRGAAANGGGGGNAHNAGGGGGANARKAGQVAWSGQGVMKDTVVGGAAWSLDPAVVGGVRTNSEGGGRGGYSYSNSNQNALTVGPGSAAWLGNNRSERGGLGGRPLDPSVTTKLFLGGGGGAGDGNDNNPGAGAAGGGLAFVMAGSITSAGTGRIRANGAKAQDADATDGGSANGDAPGGGGGGGTVVVKATSLANISIAADGGQGGIELINSATESEGPGGGGGGGFVALSGTKTAVVVSAAGAAAGTTTSTALSEFPSNGATFGNDGVADALADSLALCTTPPDTSFTTSEPNPTDDPTGDFVFASTVPGSTFECSVDAAAFAVCSATFSTAALAVGSHTIAVRAVDPAGFRDLTPATYTWVVTLAPTDTTPPETTIPTAEPNPTNDSTGDFVFASDDPAATFECSVDGAAFAACSATFSTAALADGPHTIAVRAKDLAGNLDATPATHAWVVDTAAPDTAIDLKPTNPTSDTTADFTFSSDDATASFECSLDGAAFAACSSALTTGALSAGSHTLQVRAKDAAGNLDATPATYTWTVNVPAGTDTDGDGLSDDDEKTIGTNPNDADSDDDGVPDGSEPQHDQDSDGDGLINALDPDSDNDGIFDGTEIGLSKPNEDTDLTKKNFVADADPATKTDPTKADTDLGGVPDGAEDPNHNGKIDARERNPNLAADDANKPTDSDGDGLSDDEEVALGTDPRDADSDDDGVLDGTEPNPSADSDGDGLINPLDPDSDNDGLLDGTELGVTAADKDTDVSQKHFIADADPSTKTNPLDPDTDHGSVRDGAEDFDLDGKLDAGEGNPLDPADDKSIVDSDGDGLSDGVEVEIGTDPNDADSDDDGVLDGLEPNPTLDVDGDGKINALDPDSDGDGLFDGTELGLPCTAKDTNLASGSCVRDADGGATTTSPLDPDTDHGGVEDGVEDANHDGKVGSGETDPNDRSDDTTPTGDAGAGGSSQAGGPAVAGEGGASGASGSAGSASVAGNGGIGGGIEPGVVVLGGGICSVHAPGHTNSQSALWLALSVAALAVSRRRRRAPEGP